MGDDLTKSNDPRLVASRIFIGNLPTDRCTKEDVQNHFMCHGEILGISMYKGFGFVQFKEIVDAQRTVERENQHAFLGNILDIRLASEGRKPRPIVTHEKRPYANREQQQQHYRPRSPSMEFRGTESFDRPPGGGPPPPFYPGPPPPFGAGGAPVAGNFPPGRPPPNSMPMPQEPPRYEQFRADPPMTTGGPPMIPAFSAAPIGRPHPSTNAPAASPPPTKKPKSDSIERPSDATIVVCDKKYLSYAEMVERRLMEMNLTVDVVILIRADLSARTLDALARKGGIYVVVIDEQHFEHQSVTVNVIHGTPQEHRNMALDDALRMLSRDYSSYMNKLRAGSEQPALNFLLHLLADGKNMAQPEIERIIEHLWQRLERERNPIAEQKSAAVSNQSSVTVAPPAGRPPTDNRSVPFPPSSTQSRPVIKQDLSPVKQASASASSSQNLQYSKFSQDELQQRILSILSGDSSNALSAGASTSTASSATRQSHQPTIPAPPSTAPSLPQQSSTATPQSSAVASNGDLQKTLQTILANPVLRNLLPNVSKPMDQQKEQSSSLKTSTGQSLAESGRGMPTGSNSSVQPPYQGLLGGANAYGMMAQQYQQMQQMQQNSGVQQQMNGGQHYQPQNASGAPGGANQYQQPNAPGRQSHQETGVGHYGQQLPQGGQFPRVDTVNLPGTHGGYYRHPPPPSGGGNRGLLG